MQLMHQWDVLEILVLGNAWTLVGYIAMELVSPTVKTTVVRVIAISS